MLGVENPGRNWYTWSGHLGTQLIQFLDSGTQLVFPPDSWPLKMGPIGCPTENNIAYAHCMLDNWGYRRAHTHTHTHTVCNTYCFSTATVVKQTCLNTSNFYALWLSRCSLFMAGTPGKDGTVASAGACCLCGAVGVTHTSITNEYYLLKPIFIYDWPLVSRKSCDVPDPCLLSALVCDVPPVCA